MKTKRIMRKVSQKQSARLRFYNKVRDAFLQDRECAVHGNGCKATEVHHMKGRIGNLLWDTNYFLPVCRAAHHQIEMNPEWAKENGFSLSRLGTFGDNRKV